MGLEIFREWLTRFVKLLFFRQISESLSALLCMVLKLLILLLQDRFKDWESSGVGIVPVLSQPEDDWKGETGYVQVACDHAMLVNFEDFSSLVEPINAFIISFAGCL